jgi:hypothetical protein
VIGPLVWLGFVLGLRHALEADHVAAVASLATRGSALKDTVRVAAAWGLGHAVVLILAGSLLVAVGTALPHALTRPLEAIAGGTLIVLGIAALRRAPRAADEEALGPSLVPQALLVGGVHGLEGSAALIVVALPTLSSTARALAYLAVFGAGSIVGMVLSSLAISLPLRYSGRRLARGGRWLRWAVGASTIFLGGWVVTQALWS